MGEETRLGSGCRQIEEDVLPGMMDEEEQKECSPEVLHEVDCTGAEDKLLQSFCPPEGSIDQTTSEFEYWVYLDNKQNIKDHPLTGTVDPPATPVTHRPCPFLSASSPVSASTISALGGPMASSSMIDPCSPISSICVPPDSNWDPQGSTFRNPGCLDHDAVSAAAHLHLLGESLSLIGHHLQETDKLVSMSGSLSLLLDSLLCALAPLICLTVEIPELRSCTQQTQASTLENIAYVMPGM